MCPSADGNQTARVFVVGPDVEAGLAALQSGDLEYSVTNGPVAECYVLFLDIAARPDGAWAASDPDATAD